MASAHKTKSKSKTKSKTKAKNKGGRPSHKPTKANRQKVAEMSMSGLPKKHIAKVIGIVEETLNKHYAEELEHHNEILVNMGVKCLVNFINDETVNDAVRCRAAEFLLKTRGRFSEKHAHEIKGEIHHEHRHQLVDGPPQETRAEWLSRVKGEQLQIVDAEIVEDESGDE